MVVLEVHQHEFHARKVKIELTLRFPISSSSIQNTKVAFKNATAMSISTLAPSIYSDFWNAFK